MSGPPDGGVRVAAWEDVDPLTLHAIVRLRVDVFVVEQACPYPEIDGRDVEPEVEHVWTSLPGVPVAAYLRVLPERGGGRRVGRVVTAPAARGTGLAGRLLADVVRRHGHERVVLDAQAHLQGWYARFGFTASGPEFVEDGIPHVPMTRPPGPAAGATPGGMGEAGAVTEPTSQPATNQPADRDNPDLDPAEPVVDPAVDDPDVLAASATREDTDDAEVLTTDRLEPDLEDDGGYDPPQEPSPVIQDPDTDGLTERTLEERLEEEEPEPDPLAAGRADADHDLRET